MSSQFSKIGTTIHVSGTGAGPSPLQDDDTIISSRSVLIDYFAVNGLLVYTSPRTPDPAEPPTPSNDSRILGQRYSIC